MIGPTKLSPWLSEKFTVNRVTAGETAGRHFQTAKPPIAALRTIAIAMGSARFQIGPDLDVAGGVAGGAAMMDCNSTRISPADCHRFLGFFSRHRCNNSRSRGSRFAGNKFGSGSLFSTEARTSDTESPPNACLPVRISYNTHP